ncbi:MAG: hypothetical protein JXC33_12355 [Deltaproteobacteria bacterium]|nr:hypothetical protein [Deltaproteobacteria bacterium]
MEKKKYPIINVLLKPFELALQKKSLSWERDVLLALHESRIEWSEEKAAYPVECIIFSKDRALQLHALLTTYFQKVSPPPPVHILYQTSGISHQKAYEDVITLFAGDNTYFIKQKDDHSFREDLLHLLESLQSEKVFFLVDDDLFIEDVNMTDFANFDTDKFVPSLRMGLNLSECYTLQKEQPQPEFLPSPFNDPDKIVWRWDQGVYDWGYPLSVDGHLFSTREIIVLTKFISFNAPNSYESNLQDFCWLFSTRSGTGYRKSKIVNIACNKVQAENDNICGNVHQDYLLEQWHSGLQMDYRQLYGFVNKSAHQDITFDLIERSSM